MNDEGRVKVWPFLGISGSCPGKPRGGGPNRYAPFALLRGHPLIESHGRRSDIFVIGNIVRSHQSRDRAKWSSGRICADFSYSLNQTPARRPIFVQPRCAFFRQLCHFDTAGGASTSVVVFEVRFMTDIGRSHELQKPKRH